MKWEGEPLPLEVQQLLAPFFPGFDLSRVRVSEPIPRYVRLFSTNEPLGYTDRNRIYFAPGAYRIDCAEGLALIAHEVAHCWQYQELGTWRFRAKYLLAYFRNRLRGMNAESAYAQIPFEIEARAVEGRVLLALMHLQSEFLPME